MRTFFEPRPNEPRTFEPCCHDTPYHITLHTGRHQNTTPKAKRKASAWNFLFNISCRYTPPVQTFITTSLLHPSKAHRICSVKTTLGNTSGNTLQSYANNLFLFLMFTLFGVLLWTRVGMLWRDGRLGNLQHFTRRRKRPYRSPVFWVRCFDLFAFYSTLHMFYFRFGEYPNVSLKFVGRSRSRCSGRYQ
jgi:hypothetical protein